MKKIEQMISLLGEWEEITMMELRQHPGDIFKQVELGKIFIVKRSGKIIGYIQKPPGDLTTIIDAKGNASYRPAESKMTSRSKDETWVG